MSFTKFIKPSVNPTLDTDAYTAGDVMGGLLQFDVSGFVINGGIINQAVLIDEDSIGLGLKLYLFEAQPTTIADDAAFAPTIDDVNKMVAVIAFPSFTTINSMDYSIIEDINNIFVTTGAVLYGYLVADGASNHTNADAITIRLYILSEQ